MGNNASSEASGVKCVECGYEFPQNNWSFVHLDDHGWVYVCYTLRHDSVRVKESVDLGVGFQNGKPGVNIGLGNERTMTQVKVIDYIRNKTKEDGYTCLTCLYNNCRAGYPGCNRVMREVNSLLRTHGIYVEQRRFQTELGM